MVTGCVQHLVDVNLNRVSRCVGNSFDPRGPGDPGDQGECDPNA